MNVEVVENRKFDLLSTLLLYLLHKEKVDANMMSWELHTLTCKS